MYISKNCMYMHFIVKKHTHSHYYVSENKWRYTYVVFSMQWRDWFYDHCKNAYTFTLLLQWKKLKIHACSMQHELVLMHSHYYYNKKKSKIHACSMQPELALMIIWSSHLIIHVQKHYIHEYAQAHTYTRKCTCIYIYIYIYIHIQEHYIHEYAHAHTYTRTHVITYIYIYIYIYIGLRKHANKQD